MEINFDNLNQAIAALEQCANENKGKLTDTTCQTCQGQVPDIQGRHQVKTKIQRIY